MDYSYEACMEESRLVMLTCAKGAMKAANIMPREARARPHPCTACPARAVRRARLCAHVVLPRAPAPRREGRRHRAAAAHAWPVRASGRAAPQVDILITASTFAPVPSLSAMVANYFGMRSDVLHYSLAGQGCTSGIIEVELAQHLLKARARALPHAPARALTRAPSQRRPRRAARRSAAEGCRGARPPRHRLSERACSPERSAVSARSLPSLLLLVDTFPPEGRHRRP